MLVRVALLVVALLVAAPVASASTPASSAAKKKCKAGYTLKTVKKNGKKRKVCKKKKTRRTGPAGPSVAEVESIIRGIAQAGHETWLGPESMEVSFEKPTKVLPMRMYNPYEADPLTATGEVQAWPVLAWTKIVNHRDDTPADDTSYGGCLGHLNSWWPYDSLYMFFRGQSGEWTFLTSTDDAKECG